MIETAAFYILSGLLIVSAIMIVTQRNIFTCALYLASALSMVGGIFVLLGADFLAAVQILLYVGGILVIIAFAVMLSSIQQAQQQRQVNEQWIPAAMLCAIVFAIILIAFKKNPFPSLQAVRMPTTGSIGRLLLGDMVLPFEVVSLVLLASLVGAVIFSKKESMEQTK